MSKSGGMNATDTHSLTVAQTADALGVSERTVWRYLKSGRLKGTTVGESGAQRTIISRRAIESVQQERAGTDIATIRAERDHLAHALAAVQAERDALRGRVAALQSSLARPARQARVERMLGGAMAAVSRVRMG